MLTNITMLVHNRPALTRQALDSLYRSTKADSIYLTVLDDASDPEMREVLENECKYFPRHTIVPNDVSRGTGAARNQVITAAMEWGCGDYLYLSDNDVCFTPHWLEALIEAYEYARAELGFVALGAYNHPYNQPHRKWPFYSTHLGRVIEIGQNHALALQSWLWRWEDWERFGPFDQTPPGRVRMSEDFAVSQKIAAAGYKVGSIYPPLIYNTGVTDSFSEPIPGAELIERPEGVLVL
jgi:GT2 family glycosyltransferase